MKQFNNNFEVKGGINSTTFKFRVTIAYMVIEF